MSFEQLKNIFDAQTLAFDGVDIVGNDLVAVMRDAAGQDIPYTRFEFVGEFAQPFDTLSPALQEASRTLSDFTHECFRDLFLCHDYARWLLATELSPEVFSFSFHVNPSVPDDDATAFILTSREIVGIGKMLAQPIEKLLRTAPCAIQCALETNLEVLQGALNPEKRRSLDAGNRISAFTRQPRSPRII